MTTTTFRHAISVLRLRVAGRALPPEIDTLFVRGWVEDSLVLPDSFVLQFRDPSRRVLGATGAEVGAVVEFRVVTDQDVAGQVLLTGEITAIEAEHDPLGSWTIIRGYDKSHRLFRGRATETYRNVTAADVARRVAARCGLEVGRIDATSTVLSHVSQLNQNDWQFLQQLAREVGFEVAVRDGRLDFRQPAAADGAPAPGGHDATTPLQLTLGTNLIRFRVGLTAAEQVADVEVRSWDGLNKRELVGRSSTETTGARPGTTPRQLAARFGSRPRVEADIPYGTQAEVDDAARAVADEVAGAGVSLEGVAEGSPRLRAGAAVSLGLVGPPFEGRYVLTSTTHRFDPQHGYTTAFTVSGRQDQSTLSLSSGGLAASRGTRPRPLHGVFPALVTNLRDPQHLGRVKLRYPWLSATYESDWARSCVAGAGARRGASLPPQVGDEVLVAFEHGDPRRPYVLGGLHNTRDRPPTSGDIDDATGTAREWRIETRSRSRLLFRDRDQDIQIELATADQDQRIVLDKTSGTITIQTNGDISLDAGGDVDIVARRTLRLRGGTVQIESDGQTDVQGRPLRLN